MILTKFENELVTDLEKKEVLTYINDLNIDANEKYFGMFAKNIFKNNLNKNSILMLFKYTGNKMINSIDNLELVVNGKIIQKENICKPDTWGFGNIDKFGNYNSQYIALLGYMNIEVYGRHKIEESEEFYVIDDHHIEALYKYLYVQNFNDVITIAPDCFCGFSLKEYMDELILECLYC